jgi:hypothetical protein
MSARKEKDIEPYGGLIIGVDPAGASTSGDRTAIAWRKGRVVLKVETKRGLDLMQVAGWIQNINKQDKPDRIAIDITGLGVGLYDRLRETLRNRDILTDVNFAGKPVDIKPLDEAGKHAGGAANRRAELYMHFRSALLDRFKLPDRDDIQADLCSFGYKYNSQGQLLLESKVDLKKRGMPSPDTADAIALILRRTGWLGPKQGIQQKAETALSGHVSMSFEKEFAAAPLKRVFVSIKGSKQGGKLL